VYLLVFHAYINEMHGSRNKIPSKKSRPYIYDVKFLALLGASYIYDISRLRVNVGEFQKGQTMQNATVSANEHSLQSTTIPVYLNWKQKYLFCCHSAQ
jgi:hypothetical protein